MNHTDTPHESAHAERARRRDERDRRPVPLRLAAFTLERFPPPPQLLLLTLLWAAGVTLVVPIWSVPGAAIDVSWTKLALSFVGTLLFFFHLRVMDDVKDAPTDREHEQSRPIPRGLVTEAEADMLTVLLLVAEAAVFLPLGKAVFAHWAIAAAYTVLMRVEFFVGTWLEKHVLAYATSHMVIMPLIFAFIMAAGASALVVPDLDVSGEQRTIALVALAGSYCIGLGFELGRKFERYVRAHGRFAWSLWMLVPCAGVLLFTYVARAAFDLPVLIAMGLVSVATIVLHGRAMANRPRIVGAAAGQRGGTVHEGAVRPGMTWTEAEWEQVPDGTRGRLELLPAVAGLLTFLVLAAGGIAEVRW